MSQEYGLAVSLAAVTKELDRFQTAMREDDHPVFLGIGLFDLGDQRVVAESVAHHHRGWITDGVIKLIMENSATRHAFISLTEDACCQLLLLRQFNYKAHVKGYLVAALNLDLVHEKMQNRKLATKDDFSGLVDPTGILISGQHELLGKGLHDVLGVSRAAITGVEILDVLDTPQESGIDSVVVAGSNLLDTVFS